VADTAVAKSAAEIEIIGNVNGFMWTSFFYRRAAGTFGDLLRGGAIPFLTFRSA
jgi:hypothetical protein